MFPPALFGGEEDIQNICGLLSEQGVGYGDAQTIGYWEARRWAIRIYNDYQKNLNRSRYTR